jgi:hypothetical protein
MLLKPEKYKRLVPCSLQFKSCWCSRCTQALKNTNNGEIGTIVDEEIMKK